jgi:hypothetical protein
MQGGVKYTKKVMTQLTNKKTKKIHYKNLKRGIPAMSIGVVPKQKTTIKKVKKPIKLKATLEKLIFTDMEPNEFIIDAIVLIKILLKLSKKDKKKADKLVIALVESLYYALKKENNINDINYNSNNTSSSYMSESNIWNDPYSLLKKLVEKLDLYLETNDQDFILEMSETIKDALKNGYNKIYNKPASEVDELSEMFSGTKI